MKDFLSKIWNVIKERKQVWLIVFVLSYFAFGFIVNQFSDVNKSVVNSMEYWSFEQAVESGEVSKVVIDFDEDYFIFEKDEEVYKTSNPKKNDMKHWLLINKVQVDEIENKSTSVAMMFEMFRLFLMFGILYIFMRRMMPTNKKQTLVTEIPKVNFGDIAGCNELKKDMGYLVEFLKDPTFINEVGARIPKGVVLYGPPGTGKTLTAKALAGEAGVPFFNVSGSDFVEMFVGLGAKRVRDLYDEARKNAPCIVFIDEIDAVGTKRGSGNNSEKDQTINALLSELDGFSGSEGIVTIVATNRLENLDTALIRPGRFDRHLKVPMPEKDDRIAILKVHARGKEFDGSVDFKDLANMTIGMSGAELEALVNESAIITASDRRKIITKEDIDDAFFKMVTKGHKKDNQSSRDKEELELVAWHEAGHALAIKMLTNDDVPKVTILGSTSGFGGITFRNPEKSSLYTKKYIESLIMMLYAGRASEEIFLDDKDDITNGATKDFQQATDLLKDYVFTFGMSEKFGKINFASLYGDNIISLPNEVLVEMTALSNKFYNEILKKLKEEKAVLEEIANKLYENESLSGSELDSILANKIKTKKA